MSQTNIMNKDSCVSRDRRHGVGTPSTRVAWRRAHTDASTLEVSFETARLALEPTVYVPGERTEVAGNARLYSEPQTKLIFLLGRPLNAKKQG